MLNHLGYLPMLHTNLLPTTSIFISYTLKLGPQVHLKHYYISRKLHDITSQMPVVLTVPVVKTSYLALKYSSKKLIYFFKFYFQVTHPHCPSKSIYIFFNSPSCYITTAGTRIQQCTQQKSLAANVDETLYSCTDSFSRQYIVFITKHQPRLIYGNRKNVLRKMSCSNINAQKFFRT